MELSFLIMKKLCEEIGGICNMQCTICSGGHTPSHEKEEKDILTDKESKTPIKRESNMPVRRVQGSYQWVHLKVT